VTAGLGGIFAALYAGHQVGDLWVQTPRQAAAKGLPGWPGRLACARHVVTLTTTSAIALAAVALTAGVTFRPLPVLAGLAVNGASHYWADLRSTLAGLAAWVGYVLIPGKDEFYRLGAPRPGHDDNVTLGTGAYHLDQAWHVAWLFISALVIARGWRS
jgi:hypothetical protein